MKYTWGVFAYEYIIPRDKYHELNLKNACLWLEENKIIKLEPNGRILLCYIVKKDQLEPAISYLLSRPYLTWPLFRFSRAVLQRITTNPTRPTDP